MAEVFLPNELMVGAHTRFKTALYDLQEDGETKDLVPPDGHNPLFCWREYGSGGAFTEENATVDAVNDRVEFFFSAGIPSLEFLEFYFIDVDGASEVFPGEDRFIVRVRQRTTGE